MKKQYLGRRTKIEDKNRRRIEDRKLEMKETKWKREMKREQRGSGILRNSVDFN